MATIDKINIGNTVYDISTIHEFGVLIEGSDAIDVQIDENISELDIMILDTPHMVAGEGGCSFYVKYLDQNGSEHTIIGLNNIADSYPLKFMCKLIRTNETVLQGLYITQYRETSESLSSVPSVRMYPVISADGFSALHTLRFSVSNSNERSSGAIQVEIVEKK